MPKPAASSAPLLSGWRWYQWSHQTLTPSFLTSSKHAPSLTFSYSSRPCLPTPLSTTSSSLTPIFSTRLRTTIERSSSQRSGMPSGIKGHPFKLNAYRPPEGTTSRTNVHELPCHHGAESLPPQANHMRKPSKLPFSSGVPSARGGSSAIELTSPKNISQGILLADVVQLLHLLTLAITPAVAAAVTPTTQNPTPSVNFAALPTESSEPSPTSSLSRTYFTGGP